MAPDLGASISVLYNSAGPFVQIGVGSRIREVAVLLSQMERINEFGHQFETGAIFRGVVKSAGCLTFFIKWKQYLRLLYKNLKDMSKVKLYCGLEVYVESEESVLVTTTGGKVAGSIFVGIDGIHSTVRELMARAVAKNDLQRGRDLTQCQSARFSTIFLSHLTLLTLPRLHGPVSCHVWNLTQLRPR
ncbi:hypothetical protein GQ53DRAFT_750917 [Thozetella sp. PMI_491]|nr:hypothetical protein GQ53DRAFT_750917 [Thozetella sp. PMI_491]